MCQISYQEDMKKILTIPYALVSDQDQVLEVLEEAQVYRSRKRALVIQ